MKIPTFKEAEAVVTAWGKSARAPKPTALHRFVEAFEPAGPGEASWRVMLQDVVVEASRRANVVVPLDPPEQAVREGACCRHEGRSCIVGDGKPHEDDGSVRCHPCVEACVRDYKFMVSLTHGMTK